MFGDLSVLWRRLFRRRPQEPDSVEPAASGEPEQVGPLAPALAHRAAASELADMLMSH